MASTNSASSGCSCSWPWCKQRTGRSCLVSCRCGLAGRFGTERSAWHTHWLAQEIRTEFGASLVELGVLTIATAVVAALCSVLSGSLGNSMNRTRLLAVGCVGWGGASILIAWTNYWRVFCFGRLVVGASMALVGPIQKGLLADLVVCAFRAIELP